MTHMTNDGCSNDADRIATEELVEFYARQKVRREEFTDAQLAALDALWRAKRDGQVTHDAAQGIERLIRIGHVRDARKRLSVVRRDGRAAPE